MAREPVFLAIHRHRERVFMKRLSRQEHRILAGFGKGMSLNALLKARSQKLSPDEVLKFFTAVSSLGWLWMPRQTNKRKTS